MSTHELTAKVRKLKELGIVYPPFANCRFITNSVFTTIGTWQRLFFFFLHWKNPKAHFCIQQRIVKHTCHTFTALYLSGEPAAICRFAVSRGYGRAVQILGKLVHIYKKTLSGSYRYHLAACNLATDEMYRKVKKRCGGFYRLHSGYFQTIFGFVKHFLSFPVVKAP